MQKRLMVLCYGLFGVFGLALVSILVSQHKATDVIDGRIPASEVKAAIEASENEYQLSVSPKQISFDSKLALGLTPLTYKIGMQDQGEKGILVTEEVGLLLTPPSGKLLNSAIPVNGNLNVKIYSSQVVRAVDEKMLKPTSSRALERAMQLVSRILSRDNKNSADVPLEIQIDESVKLDISSQVSAKIPLSGAPMLNNNIGASGGLTLVFNKTKEDQVEIFVQTNASVFNSLGWSSNLTQANFDLVPNFLLGLNSFFHVDQGAKLSETQVLGFALNPNNSGDWEMLTKSLWNIILPQNRKKASQMNEIIKNANNNLGDFQIIQVGQKREKELYGKFGINFGKFLSLNSGTVFSSQSLMQKGPRVVSIDANVETFMQTNDVDLEVAYGSAIFRKNHVVKSIYKQRDTSALNRNGSRADARLGSLQKIIFNSHSGLNAQAGVSATDISKEFNQILGSYKNWKLNVDISTVVPNLKKEFLIESNLTFAIRLPIMVELAEFILNEKKGQLQSVALGGGIISDYLKAEVDQAFIDVNVPSTLITDFEKESLVKQLGNFFEQLHFLRKGDKDELTMVSLRDRVRSLALNPLSNKVLPFVLYNLSQDWKEWALKEKSLRITSPVLSFYNKNIYLDINTKFGNEIKQLKSEGTVELAEVPEFSSL